MTKLLLLVLFIVALATSVSAFGMGTPLKTRAVVASPKQGCGDGMTMRARVCDLLGKRPNRQHRVVSFSHKRHKTVQHVNLQWRRYYSEELGRTVRLRLSTKGLKTVNKYGSIDSAAKKFGLDLSQF